MFVFTEPIAQNCFSSERDANAWRDEPEESARRLARPVGIHSGREKDREKHRESNREKDRDTA